MYYPPNSEGIGVNPMDTCNTSYIWLGFLLCLYMQSSLHCSSCETNFLWNMIYNFMWIFCRKFVSHIYYPVVLPNCSHIYYYRRRNTDKWYLIMKYSNSALIWSLTDANPYYCCKSCKNLITRPQVIHTTSECVMKCTFAW